MVGKVIKGRKYILAGNFPKEYKQTFIDGLKKDLGIKIVAIVTSDYTSFIEYDDKDSELEKANKVNAELIEENKKIEALKYNSERLVEELRRERQKKKPFFKF